MNPTQQRQLIVGAVFATFVMQGITIGGIFNKYLKLAQGADYLTSIIAKNDVELDEFDIIALKQLDILK